MHSDECRAGCRAEESTVGLLEAGRGSPRHTCGVDTAGQGQFGGVATGHEETESRFLGRAQAVVGKIVARGALPRNDRLGSAARDSGGSYAPGLVKQHLSFRGPPTLQSDECVAGCRAEESTVGLLEAGRGSPRDPCGGETAGRGQCGASRQATRKRKVDSSVARKRLCGSWLHAVRSLGMTDWGVRPAIQGVPTHPAWSSSFCHSEARPHCNQKNAPQVAGPRNLPSACWRPDAVARARRAAAKQPDGASAGRRGRPRGNGK